MKKILCLVLVALLLVTGCNSKVKEGKLTNISFDKYVEKIEKEESFVLLIWRTGCSHCEEFEPKLKEVIGEYNIKVYSMDISEISDSEYEKLKNKTFVTGTPTTVIFEKGKNKDKMVGNRTKEAIIDFFKTNGYIGE